MITLDPHVLALCETVQRAADASGTRLFLVGGYVRDLVRGVFSEDADVDFMVDGDARILAARVARELGAHCTTHDRFLTAKISVSGFGLIREVDFASARREVYPTPGALPEVSLSSVEDDLRRRDFSINAMACGVPEFLGWARGATGSLPPILDPFSGQRDLIAQWIRILHPRSFIDDPTRIFRAVRYASRLHFRLESDTEQALRDAVVSGALRAISSTRIVNELQLVMLEPGAGFELLSDFGVLEIVPGFERRSARALSAAASLRVGLNVPEATLALREQLFLLFLSAVTSDDAAKLAAFIGLRKSRAQALLKIVSAPQQGQEIEALFVRACGIGCPVDSVAQEELRRAVSRSP